jgi:hypothetical protein
LTLKHVTAQDVLKESSDPTAHNDDERFDFGRDADDGGT